MNGAFWEILDRMIEEHEVVIDRPGGSRHPRYPHVVYPMDYGYLQGTSSMDGEGIDVWIGSQPEAGLTAIVCTADRLKGDSEIKLLIGCTEEEAAVVEAFLNASDYMKGLLIRREQ